MPDQNYHNRIKEVLAELAMEMANPTPPPAPTPQPEAPDDDDIEIEIDGKSNSKTGPIIVSPVRPDQKFRPPVPDNVPFYDCVYLPQHGGTFAHYNLTNATFVTKTHGKERK